MLHKIFKVAYLKPIIQGIVLVSFYLFPENVQANPIITKTEQDILDEPSTLVITEERHLATEVEVKKDNFIILENTVNSKQAEETSSCLTFTPLTNTITPNISSTKEKENQTKATSNCAADLIGISNPEPLKVFQDKNSDSSLNLPETSPKSSQDLPVVETTQTVEDNRWHFKLQPYATIPVNTYGTVSARGQTVSYHLSLGELLDTLRATASGRFEGWNGRWGFIIDGYFASLQDIGNLQISRSRNPNPINVLNFLLNRGINTRLQEVVNVIDQEIQLANNIQQVREAQTFQNLERQVQDLEIIVSEDVQELQELQVRFQEFEDKVITGRQTIEVLETRIEDLQNLDSKINTLENFRTNYINNINTEQFKEFLDLDFQNLNNQERVSNQLTNIEQVGQELRQTRNNLENVTTRVRELRNREDSAALQNLETKLEEVKTLLDDRVITDKQKLDELLVKLEDLRTIESPINLVTELGLNNTQQLRQIISLNGQNLSVIDNLQDLTTRIQELNRVTELNQLRERLSQTRDNLERASQRVKELRAQEDSTALQTLETKLEEAKTLLDDEVITDEKKLENLVAKLEDLKTIESQIDLIRELGLNDIESLEEIISLRVQDLPIIDDLQDLNNQIQELNKLTDLNQIEQKLIQTRDNLEQVSRQVKELRSQQDSEALQNLDNQLEQAKVLLDREIQAVNQIQDFLENQQPQQLEANIGASLQFDQGIYDFALSYHIGDLPSHELPEKPSNRNFPLIWFQPIVGVRLNDISIEIDTINRFEISSSLINVQGTVQRKFERGRTWFEPLLGGKFGIQISDPITFWLRGDASGFGIAGETDISWNLLFGVDWWIHQQISLQLGYHFYEIDYKTGNDNDFRFEENLNGPFISATFHF